MKAFPRQRLHESWRDDGGEEGGWDQGGGRGEVEERRGGGGRRRGGTGKVGGRRLYIMNHGALFHGERFTLFQHSANIALAIKITF